MASAVLGPIAKMALAAGADKLKNEILGKKYGDATETIEVILAAQKESFTKVHFKIEKVVAQNELDKEALQVEKWADDMKERLEKAKNGEEKPLHDLYVDLNDTDDGIHKIMLTINALLTGTATQDSSRGLIDLYLERLYDKLGAHDDMDYGINSYLIDIGRYLERQFKLQDTALALRLAAATPTDPIESWKRKMAETRQGQIKFAWDRFPPMIRKLKADFGSTMDTIHWWRLRGNNGKVLTREHALWSESYKNFLNDSNEGPCPGTEFRFQPSLDSEGLIRVQLRSDKGRYLSGYYSSGGGGVYAVNPGSGWGQALFQWSDAAQCKIVPEKEPSGEPKFKIVPQNKGLRSVYPYNKDWVLTDDGVGQWD